MVGMLLKMKKETYVLNNGTPGNQENSKNGNINPDNSRHIKPTPEIPGNSNKKDIYPDDPRIPWPIKPREVCEHFCRYTSAHGLSNLYGACQWRKIFWGTVILVAAVGLLVHINIMATQYLRYHYTESSRESRSGYSFPGKVLRSNWGSNLSI